MDRGLAETNNKLSFAYSEISKTNEAPKILIWKEKKK
jgi:hypothetical protein